MIERCNDFDQPETVVIIDPDNQSIPVNFPFPAVVKPTHGFQGKHVKKCETVEEAKKHIAEVARISKTHSEHSSIGYGLLVQEYIDFNEEYRVNVIAGKSIGTIVKISDHWVKNGHMGATFETKRYDQKVIDIAERCTNMHGLFFAGVDIGRKDGDLYLIECNRSPQFKLFDEAIESNTARLLLESIRLKLPSADTSITDTEVGTPEKTTDKGQRVSVSIEKANIANLLVQSTQVESDTTLNIHESSELIDKLLELVSNSDIGDQSKADAVSDLNSIKSMGDKSSDPDVLQSIERKIGSLNKIVTSSSNIVSKGLPIITKLAALFGIGL